MKRTEVKLSDVKSVYSGRAGACCCGCSGNYRYPSTVTKEEFMREHGRPLNCSEQNDVQVKRIVGLINKAILENNPTLDFGARYVAVENEANTRIYIVYLNEVDALATIANEITFSKEPEDDGHAAAELSQGVE